MQMLVHSVYFNFKSNVSEEDRRRCMHAAKGLGEIKYAAAYYVGTPAAVPDRPVIVSDYDFGLTGFFESVADHDAYQVDPVHVAFVEGFKDLWESVRVFDFD